MRKRSKTSFWVFLVLFLLSGGTLGAQAAPAAPPPSSKAMIFPLTEVRQGLQGVAYTVFEGTKPEAMNVEIVGVLRNALGPKQDLILARLQGAKPEYTGVVAGMSGSPVYIDGRLLGAISYRIGQFSKDPIAGITPIGEMLGVDKYAEPVSKSALRGPAESDPAAEMADASGADSGMAMMPGREANIRPIDTPLVFSGFSPEAVNLFADRFRKLGFMPVAGLGGASPSGQDSGSGGGPDNGPLIPGSAVSALVVQGDLQVAATCTVTFVDPSQVLACGHPITQAGAVSMPMTKADVLMTLASLQDSIKIINTGQTIGAFTDDRESAIRGVLGAQAHMIPVQIHLRSGEQTHDLNLEVIDNPDLTSSMVMVSIYQALLQNNQYGTNLSYMLQGSVTIHGYPPLRVASLVAPTDEIPAALGAAMKFAQAFNQIYANSARARNVEKIELTVETLPGRRSVELTTAQILQPWAHAGDTVTVEATLRPYQGEIRNVRIPVRLPGDLSPGTVRILVSDGSALDRLTAQYPGVNPPSDLNGMIGQLNATRADDRLYVTLLSPQAQAVIAGQTLPGIPISVANVFAPLRENREMSLHGESVVPVTSIPVDATLSGQQVLSLEIQ